MNIDGFLVYFLQSIVDVFQSRPTAFIFQQSLNAAKRLKAHARVTPYATKAFRINVICEQLIMQLNKASHNIMYMQHIYAFLTALEKQRGRRLCFPV